MKSSLAAIASLLIWSTSVAATPPCDRYTFEVIEDIENCTGMSYNVHRVYPRGLHGGTVYCNIDTGQAAIGFGPTLEHVTLPGLSAPTFNSNLAGITADGTLVGRVTFAGGGAAVWVKSGDELDEYPIPAGYAGIRVNAVSADGTIIARLFGGPDGDGDTAFYHKGSYDDPVIVTGNRLSTHEVVTADGRVAAWTYRPDKNGNQVRRPVLLGSDGVLTELPLPKGYSAGLVSAASREGNVIAGLAFDGAEGGLYSHSVAVLWKDGEMTVRPPSEGFPRIYVFDVLSDGTLLTESQTFPVDTTLTQTILIKPDGSEVFLDSSSNPDHNGEVPRLKAVAFASDGVIVGSSRLQPSNSNREVVLTPVPEVAGDITCDGRADFQDLTTLLARWGTDDARADLDQSNLVDFQDLVMFLEIRSGS